MRKTNLLCDTLFWLFLALDVFGVCYWLASHVATLLIGVRWLRPEGALLFALITAALMTPGILMGLVSMVKRTT